MSMPKVLFLPQGKEVEAKPGRRLLDLAKEAGVVIPSTCGGDGICGRCRVLVQKGRVLAKPTALLSREEIQEGFVLACQAEPLEDLEVFIPEEEAKPKPDRDAQRFRALEASPRRSFSLRPLVLKLYLELPPPTLEDNLADLERVYRELQRRAGSRGLQMGLKIIQGLPHLLRDSQWKVTFTLGRRGEVTEVIQLEAGDQSAKNYGIAVDVGTSTIVAHLVDLVSGKTLDAEACYNSQMVFGAEVTRRIIRAQKEGIEPLQRALIDDINGLIAALVSRTGIALRDVTVVMAAGNTAMTHFLLGLDPSNIRRNPYVPVALAPPPVRAAEVGIKVNPRALLYVMPAIGGWVGGDITAGILATGLHESPQLSMLIDIGTNGEVVLGNREWMVACSTSAGPAFEGSGIRCGMRAAQGAVERVWFESDGELKISVIGDSLPKGICGSGLVDALAELFRMGYLDRFGRFRPGSPGVRENNGLWEFVLLEKGRTGTGEDIVITQADVDNLLRAKAAIYAGAKILLKSFSLTWEDIAKIHVAGGFGSYLDRKKAVLIGLLPDIPLSKIEFVGNTAILGAKMALLSEEAWEEAQEISKKATYFDLITHPHYYEEFLAAKFIPHTELSEFPSLTGERG